MPRFNDFEQRARDASEIVWCHKQINEWAESEAKQATNFARALHAEVGQHGIDRFAFNRAESAAEELLKHAEAAKALVSIMCDAGKCGDVRDWTRALHRARMYRETHLGIPMPDYAKDVAEAAPVNANAA
jgi:hypothetical protein